MIYLQGYSSLGTHIADAWVAVKFLTAANAQQDLEMTLRDIIETLKLERLTPELGDDGVAVSGGYISDLLSDVMANAPRGGALVTIQVHLNVIAVAVHSELAGVVFAAGRRPDEAVRKKAVDEGVRLYATGENAFDVAGRLYEMGLRGSEQ